MAVTEDLFTFVRDALARGLSRVDIERALVAAGWEVPEVRAALAGYADVDFPVPVPRPRPTLSARDAFLYLLLFTTLYISAYHVGSLIFELIARVFPDPVATTAGVTAHASARIRWSIASLLVASPVFLYLSALTGRLVRLDPAKRGSAVRRWLTYLTLFLAASTVIGDLIALFYSLLSGELTIRFVLEVLTVGGIAGAVFGYYLHGLRQDEAGSAR